MQESAPSGSADVAWLSNSVFHRLPAPRQRCKLSGLSRSSIIEHGEAGGFKMVRLKKPGASRGILLIHTDSFLNWLRSLPPASKEAGRR